MSLQPTWKYSLKTLQSDRKRGRREAEASVKGQQREHGKEHKFNVAVKKTSPHSLPPTADTHSQDDASGQEGSRSLDLETQAVSSAPPPSNPLVVPERSREEGVKSNIIAPVRPGPWRRGIPPEPRGGWRRKRRGRVRAEENCKAEGVEARRPSCRRQVFRTITRHLELCLPVRRSRKRKKEIQAVRERKRPWD